MTDPDQPERVEHRAVLTVGVSATQERAWVADTAGHEVTDDEFASISPIATEFVVEAASAGRCILRVVSSAYGSGADWENEYVAEMTTGWCEVPFGPDEQTPRLDNLRRRLDPARGTR